MAEDSSSTVNKHDYEVQIQKWGSLANSLKRDIGFKIIVTCITYVALFIISLFVLYKIYQGQILSVRISETPTLPSIDSLTHLSPEAGFRIFNIIVIFQIAYLLFRNSGKIGDSIFKDSFNSKFPKLSSTAKLVIRIFAQLGSIWGMLKASGGFYPMVLIFFINETFRKTIWKDSDEPEKESQNDQLLGSLMGSLLALTFVALLSVVYFSLAAWQSQDLKTGVIKVVCATPQLATLKVDSVGNMSGWYIGKNDDFYMLRRKDENDIYETVGINKSKISGITFLDRYESSEEKNYAFPSCSSTVL